MWGRVWRLHPLPLKLLFVVSTDLTQKVDRPCGEVKLMGSCSYPLFSVLSLIFKLIIFILFRVTACSF